MNEIVNFALSVILISVSGVMSPGPLFTANLIHGVKGGIIDGIKIASGHAVVELPLIILIGVGVFSLQSFPEFKFIITILGAAGLFAFAIIQIKSVFNQNHKHQTKKNLKAFETGILFSALNPFFLIWWLTIGFKLISDAIALWSFVGILALFAFHVWMDFAWLGGIASIAKKATSLISSKNFKILITALSGFLIFYGINFVLSVF